MRLMSGLYDVMVKMVMVKMVKVQSPQVHEGDCYLLALDLLQQHAATLGAAAIVVTCLMVSSMLFMVGVMVEVMVLVMDMVIVTLEKVEHTGVKAVTFLAVRDSIN